MIPGDPTGLAAHACGRGLAPEPAVPARRIREDEPLTVREAIAALRSCLLVQVDLPLFERDTIRTRLLELDRSALIGDLQACEDHDDTTRLYLSTDGRVVTLRPDA